VTRVTLGKSRVRESCTPGSVRAKAEWLSYSTVTAWTRNRQLLTSRASVSPAPMPAASAPARTEGLIEIVLPGDVLVRVDAQVDGRALRRVLGR
jgi:hypothetical protein